jgi:phenylalanyl-tRNA synthetase beta chain
MKFPLSWLKAHLDTDADAQIVADMLNRIGHEVESIENPAEKLSAFRIAKVLTAAPHPQADKLQVLTVDSGGNALQVVCGARWNAGCFWPGWGNRSGKRHGAESRRNSRR